MRFLTLSHHRLLTSAGFSPSQRSDVFSTGLPLLDALVPKGFDRGVVHEILIAPGQARPKFFATLLAKSALASTPAGHLAWCDSANELWPAALVAGGISMDRLLLLRPHRSADELWAMTECLRCRAIGVTVGSAQKLSQVEARRLQLAAERGGGIGLLFRYFSSKSAPYAAATRWLVQPATGDEQFQCWKIQLIHGQGGQIGRVILLEANRETNFVRASEIMAHRPHQTQIPRVSA